MCLVGWWQALPGPAGGACSTPPDPLAELKGRGERGGRGKREGGRKGRGDGRGREGEKDGVEGPPISEVR